MELNQFAVIGVFVVLFLLLFVGALVLNICIKKDEDDNTMFRSFGFIIMLVMACFFMARLYVEHINLISETVIEQDGD